MIEAIPHIDVAPRVDYHRVYLEDTARMMLDMQTTAHDPAKKEARRQRLAAHPEERVTLDRSRLHASVPFPFQRFVCHPGSSIARGEAVTGSDIDFGLVISDHPVPEEQQAAFVEVLRTQGFTTHTEAEFRAVKEAIQTHAPNHLQAHVAYNEIYDSVIRFRTVSGMEERIASQADPLLDPLNVLYLGGAQLA